MKLVRLIEIYLNETYSKGHMGKQLSDSFPIQNGRKQGCLIGTAFQLCFKIYLYEGSVKRGGTEIEWNTSDSGLC
jgi:hypothetical protein